MSLLTANNSKMKPVKKRSCCLTWGWIIQILTWMSAIFLIVAFSVDEHEVRWISLGVFLFLYLIYFITAFCMPSFSFLMHMQSSTSIHEYMKNLFYTAPMIQWYAECYHYVTHYHTHTDGNGNSHTTSSTEKVVTHRETLDFKYHTWRDISGTFLLDSHKVYRSESKVYIKLYLESAYELADDMSKYDFQKQKDEFFSRNKHRDTHMDFSEQYLINGFNQYNMIKIKDEESPCCINVWMYLLFTVVIPINQLYILYVDFYCLEQDFTIKKVMSTRFNLFAPEQAQQWQGVVPAVTIFRQPTIVYDQAPPVALNEPEPALPSAEEIEVASHFVRQATLNNQMPPSNANDYQPYFGINVNPLPEENKIDNKEVVRLDIKKD